MKNNEIVSLESYYQTESEWHNEKIINLIAEAQQAGNFEDIRQAIELYNFGMDCFYQNPEAPLKAIEALNNEFTKRSLDNIQALFILKKIKSCLKYSSFDDEGIEEETKEVFLKIFKAEVSRRKAKVIELIPQKPLVKNIRTTLKTWVQQELNKLPETLEELEPDKKVNVLCKLIPFVLPRVESIHYERDENEGNVWGTDW